MMDWLANTNPLVLWTYLCPALVADGTITGPGDFDLFVTAFDTFWAAGETEMLAIYADFDAAQSASPGELAQPLL